MGAPQQALLAENSAGGVTTDPSFANVVLLCHFDGTNLATATVDSSSSAHALTNGATANLSTAQSKFGGSSGRINTGFWEASDHADWTFGSGQFTIEAFIYVVSAPGSANRAILSQYQHGGAKGWVLAMLGGSLTFDWSTDGNNDFTVASVWTPTVNTWYHIAVDRDASNVIRLYIDGAVVANTTSGATFFNSTDPMSIGKAGGAYSALDCYMDDLRITKGVARYGGAFTPPTAAFPDS